MAQTDYEEVFPAATVIILRDSTVGIEILAIERAKGMGFAGGAVAFPGGKVDASDAAFASNAFQGFQSLEDEDARARVTAAREAFEESGVLLSAGPAVQHGVRSRLRPASDRHEIGFAELLAEIGHTLDASRLVPFARWMPPKMVHKRFDTRFYLAALPEGEEMQADGHEAVRARWATPGKLLDEADRNEISILFPTRCNVARIAQFDTVASLLRDQTPPPFIQPQIQQDGWLTIPEDVGYPYWRERLEGLRRG